MARSIRIIIKCIILLCISQTCLSQSEKFDIATYTPPKDWKKDVNTGTVSYTKYNTTTGTFCVIVMHASSASLGDAQKDFKQEWKDLVITPHNAEANPKTDLQTSPDGWKAVSAGAQIKIDSIAAYTILTVFSGYGKKFSILTTLNDQSYTDAVDLFLKKIQLDKSGKSDAKALPGKNETSGNETVGLQNNQFTGPANTFGLLTYNIPKNWKATRYSDGDILVPEDLPNGEVLEIWVQQSFSFPGSLEQALQKAYSESVAALNATVMMEVSGGNYVIIPVQKSFRGWDYIRCHGSIHMGPGQYPPEYGLDLFLISINGRIERVAVLKSRKNCYFSSYFSSDKYSYHDAIEDFLFSLRFSDWKDQGRPGGSTNGAGITGVWEGITLSTGMSSTGALLGAEYKGKNLILFSNGQAYFGNYLPVEGLAGVNTWILAENSRRDWGSYSFSNGRGNVKLLYADIPLVMQGNELVITTNKTDHKFVKINSVDGARFNGTYVMSSKDFLGKETGKTPTIVFTADGKFSDDGALAILDHENVSCLNPANTPGSGTYEVKEHTIIFNYNDGRKVRIAFVGTDFDKNNMSPAKLILSYYKNELLRR